QLFGRLRQHGTDAGVRILNIVDRVLFAFGQRQVDVENEFRIGTPLRQEEAHGILAYPVDEVAHGDVAAGPLGYLDLGAVTHDFNHFVQDIGREFLGNAQA